MCYSNFITVKGCDRESTSGIYANDIGIDIDFLNAISTKGQTGVQLWDSKLAFSGKVIASQIQTALADKFTAKTIIEGKRVGFNGTKTVPNKVGGLQIYVCDNSSYLDIYLSSVEVALTANDTFNVNVLDAYTLEVLDTFPVTATGGVPKVVTIDKVYTATRKNYGIIITHDSNEDSIRTTVNEGGCSTCPSNWTCGNSIAKASGVNLDGTWKLAGETNGISAVYSISCNYEAWICSIKHQLTLPILYKTGAEVYEFAKNSSVNTRTNTSVTFNKEAIKERTEELEFKYREALDNIIGNMVLPNDARCFICKQKSRHAIILP